jgi:phospholipid/cholesterol/gamma-HCH transport system substrate-binding protein
METKVNYPLVGAFVVVLGALLLGGILWLATGGAFRQKYDLYRAYEDESVSGLNLNAPVKYNGVEVGKVQEIRLDPTNPQRVNLLFAIEAGTPIRVDTVATLKAQGLTGIAYFELSGGTKGAPLLRSTKGSKYPVIRTEPSLSARLENVLTNVLAKLDSTSDNVSSFLSKKNQESFTGALADISAVMNTLAARKGTIDAALADAGRTMQNASSTMAHIGTVVDRLGTVIDGFGPVVERIGPLVDSFEPVVERIGHGADAIETMGNQVAATSAGAGKTFDSVGGDLKRFTSETLPEVDRLVGELSVLSTSLRSLIEQTERDPRGFLFGREPLPAGPGE